MGVALEENSLKILRILVGLALGAVLTGCSDASDGLAILSGNYEFQRGNYPLASLRYLQVTQKDRFGPWVNYNLGNVYNALGEANSALAVWNKVDRKAPEELLFRLAFNKGDLLYQKGLYKEAYHSFQQALLLKPANFEAKHNLELCLLKIQSFANAPAPVISAVPTTPTTQTKALLDYVQRLEGNRWKSNNTQKSSPSSSDW